MKIVAIIGGGAAGMMAACTIAEQAALRSSAHAESNLGILLFEKNSYLGAKVLISGGGRCNVTTGVTDVRELLKNYPRGAKFLTSAMYHFPPLDVFAWFESHGVPLKTEEDLRVFPISNNGKDVVGALEKELKKGEVKIHSRAQVTCVAKESANGKNLFKIYLKDGQEFSADYLILTTGGNAYRQTGSTGDGYDFAKTLGHTITPLGPSLNSLTTDASWIKNIAGVSIEKAQITLKTILADASTGERESETESFARMGDFVFTHHGVSGPAIFALSSFAAFQEISKNHPAMLHINFFPAKNAEAMEAMIDELILKNPKKKIANLLDALLPKSLAMVFAELLNIKDLTASHLSRDQRKAICEMLTDFNFQVIGRAAGEEFVSAGGVDTNEVNTNTMESKVCPHLYFAGELLDVDGFTGGYNLQASWATGHLAGESIVEHMLNR